MTEIPEPSVHFISQTEFEELTDLVSTEFPVEDAFIQRNIPTYYLDDPQETKQPFLRLMEKLEPRDMIPLLRENNGRIILRIVPKPHAEPSNILINWALFFATIATTFITGYILSLELVAEGVMSNPAIGGLSFTVAIMAVLGMHEMGHKLSANKEGIDATPPYFIPGPPPIFGLLGIGTFGAVIKQKSLPPNRDALFDVGSSGPIIGFILAVIVSVIGFLISPVFPPPMPEGGLPAPIILHLVMMFIIQLPENHYILLHPVAFAGWVGMVITMLNLLPAAMLDGGHVARAIASEKTRKTLTALSVLLLVIQGFWPMAFFVIFLSMRRHPGPLDDVSPLSTGKKLLTLVLIAIFVLCTFPHIAFI
ncbi:MAG: site-2 protease family protein [Thermoproteota archaeon]